MVTYFIGSLSSAIIICKLWGLPDPRSLGSNNPGATNVLRIGGKVPALLTMVGDALKGLLPTCIATILQLPNWAIAAVMLAALCGHIWPIFFGFKGGKGVATGMGALLGLNLYVGLILISIWALTIAVTRISSLGALLAIVLMPVVGFLCLHDVVLVSGMCLISLILLYRHKENIYRLWIGKESKV